MLHESLLCGFGCICKLFYFTLVVTIKYSLYSYSVSSSWSCEAVFPVPWQVSRSQTWTTTLQQLHSTFTNKLLEACKAHWVLCCTLKLNTKWIPPRGCSDTLTPARLFKYKVLAKGVASSCKVVDLKRSSLLSVGWHHPSQADKCIHMHMHRVSILIHNSWNTWGKKLRVT